MNNYINTNNIMKTGIIWICVMLASIGYFGCSNINDLHDQYLQRGETIYMGPVDSIKLFPGNNRIKISYRNYDPKVGKLMVYWDFRKGSAQFDVSVNNLGEEVEVIVPDLQEKQYTFELVTTNPVGQHPSIPVYISGPVYGSKYRATLNNRKINGATFIQETNTVTIEWASVLEAMVGVELLYRNSSDKETVLEVPNKDARTIFDDIGKVEIQYRTKYLPENCIDTFYTDFVPINNISLIKAGERD